MGCTRPPWWTHAIGGPLRQSSWAVEWMAHGAGTSGRRSGGPLVPANRCTTIAFARVRALHRHHRWRDSPQLRADPAPAPPARVYSEASRVADGLYRPRGTREPR